MSLMPEYIPHFRAGDPSNWVFSGAGPMGPTWGIGQFPPWKGGEQYRAGPGPGYPGSRQRTMEWLRRTRPELIAEWERNIAAARAGVRPVPVIIEERPPTAPKPGWYPTDRPVQVHDVNALRAAGYIPPAR
jgi:hypothetical protein